MAMQRLLERPMAQRSYARLLLGILLALVPGPARSWHGVVPRRVLRLEPRRAALSTQETQHAVPLQGLDDGFVPLKDLAEGSVVLWDTTLRDGTQAEGVSPTGNDKERICHRLLELGIGVVEAGFPGSNDKDAALFSRLQEAPGFNAVAAFCMSRRRGVSCEEDPGLQGVVATGARRAAMVAKASAWQVTDILGVSREEGVAMCGDSVAFLSDAGVEVTVDLEHCVDGHKSDPEYTLEVSLAAARAGAACLVICDTNGGSMPWEVEAVVQDLRAGLEAEGLGDTLVGIHCHNDCGLAAANSIAAVRAGAQMVQGCINGIGERTGNANMCTVAAIAALKLDIPCLGPMRNMTLSDTARRVKELTSVSRFVDEIFNRQSSDFQPFVGSAAFAHKGGLHVSAMAKNSDAYQHVDPEAVGNTMRVLVSDLSGKATIKKKLKDWGLLDAMSEEAVSETLQEIKSLESLGFSFEACDASVEMMARRRMSKSPFKILDYNVFTADTEFSAYQARTPHHGPYSSLVSEYWSAARATVKMELPALAAQQGPRFPGDATKMENVGISWGSEVQLHCAEGNGPVNALARALIRGLSERFSLVNDIELTDYKVRILDGATATAATARVTMSFQRVVGGQVVEWTTVGADPNILTGSLAALVDGLEYAIVKEQASWKDELVRLGI